MPRRFFSDAQRQQDWLATQADRPKPAATSKPAAKSDDEADLLPAMSAAEREDAVRRYAKDTVHTGDIVGRRAAGFVIKFGKISGILPFDKTGGKKTVVGERAKVTVTEFDGTRAPRLKR